MVKNDYEKTEKIGLNINSFYDVFPDERSAKEIREYRRTIGMPVAEDYKELLQSLK